MDMCDCGHEQARHSGTTGPCLRCNCSGFVPPDLAAAAATNQIDEREYDKVRTKMLKGVA